MRGVIIAIPIGIVLWLVIVASVWAVTSATTDDGIGTDVVRCEENQAC